MRITVACPEGLISDANHLAMALGYSEADALTYGAAEWQDSEGNLYALASFPVSDEWVGAAQSGLARPAWDTTSHISMAAAGRAQAALVFWTPFSETDAPQATTSALTALGGIEPKDALAAMGLTRATQEAAL